MLKRFGWLLACGCMALACSGDDEGGETSAAEQSSGGGDKGGGDNGGGDTGGGDNGGGDNGGGNNSAGRTPCGNFPDLDDKFCQAGQYCENMTISSCASGCLSDSNCADNQTCAKEGSENVGSCQNKPSMVDLDAECGAVCSKLQACDPAITDELCSQFCAGVSGACRACVADANCSDPDACSSVCGLDF